MRVRIVNLNAEGRIFVVPLLYSVPTGLSRGRFRGILPGPAGRSRERGCVRRREGFPGLARNQSHRRILLSARLAATLEIRSPVTSGER